MVLATALDSLDAVGSDVLQKTASEAADGGYMCALYFYVLFPRQLPYAFSSPGPLLGLCRLSHKQEEEEEEYYHPAQRLREL